MSVRIQFDKPNAHHFTNLDFVTGRVILALSTDATISAITVKLQGRSSTRLAGPKKPQDARSEKKRTELEVHKVGEKRDDIHRQPCAMLIVDHSCCTKFRPSSHCRRCKMPRPTVAHNSHCSPGNTTTHSASRFPSTTAAKRIQAQCKI